MKAANEKHDMGCCFIHSQNNCIPKTGLRQFWLEKKKDLLSKLWRIYRAFLIWFLNCSSFSRRSRLTTLSWVSNKTWNRGIWDLEACDRLNKTKILLHEPCFEIISISDLENVIYQVTIDNYKKKDTKLHHACQKQAKISFLVT